MTLRSEGRCCAQGCARTHLCCTIPCCKWRCQCQSVQWTWVATPAVRSLQTVAVAQEPDSGPDPYPETDLPLGLDMNYGKSPPSRNAKQAWLAWWAYRKHSQATPQSGTDEPRGNASTSKHKGSAGAAEGSPGDSSSGSSSYSETDSEDDFCRHRDADWLVHERYNRYFGTGDDEDKADAEPAYDERDDYDLIEDDDFDDYDETDPP
eukprot:3679832-Rhodomonas_salina.1